MNIQEIELAFNKLVEAWGATAHHGIVGGSFHREDGLPWIEISGGQIRPKTAEDFCQELANAIKLPVLFNKCTSDSLEAVVDIAVPDDITADCHKMSDDPDVAEFIEDYGTPFNPQ